MTVDVQQTKMKMSAHHCTSFITNCYL